MADPRPNAQTGAADEHPFMIGVEWAARIAEGNTDART